MQTNIAPAIKGRLTLLCVGTGRDGTTSLCQMIQNIFDEEGRGRAAGHEWQSTELNDAFCLWKETGDAKYEDLIRDTIETCPYDAIVGNGYQTVLPLFAAAYGDSLALVHLKRLDRAGCVDSLVANSIQHPINHRYYATVPEATGRRMAAFHFGEMSRESWDELSGNQRFEWYYDKVHALIEDKRLLFAKSYELFTERLAEEDSRRVISEAAGSNVVPKPVRVNRHFGFEEFDLEQRRWLQRVLGKLDIERLAVDPAYGLLHFGDELSRYLSDKVGLRNENTVEYDVSQLQSSRSHARNLLETLNDLARQVPGGQNEVSDRRFFAERAELLRARDLAITDRDQIRDQLLRKEREASDFAESQTQKLDEAHTQKRRLEEELQACIAVRDAAVTELNASRCRKIRQFAIKVMRRLGP
ncbi:hypothetical protein JQ543_11755 [Bradyrhizobium diazoefficiens]|nr:hypothetical protein [Bradyrhizobium diazoefficiens]MBR0848417.1 hypothetical protein [Bradyrhizobium diazoefficiens]